MIREELLGTAIIVLSADVEVNEAMDLPAGGWYTGMLVAAAVISRLLTRRRGEVGSAPGASIMSTIPARQSTAYSSRNGMAKSRATASVNGSALTPVVPFGTATTVTDS